MPAPAPTTRHIFIEFMARDGFSREHAAYEFDNHLTINGQARLRGSYMTVRRAGAPFSLTRTQRTRVYDTFSNAQNHASFAG